MKSSETSTSLIGPRPPRSACTYLGLDDVAVDSQRSRHVLCMRPQEPEQRHGEMSDSDLLRSWQMRQKAEEEEEEADVCDDEFTNFVSGLKAERMLPEMRLASSATGI